MDNSTKNVLYVIGCKQIDTTSDWRANKKRPGLHVSLMKLPLFGESRFSVEARRVDDIGRVTPVPINLGQDMQTHTEVIAEQIGKNAQTENRVYVSAPLGFEEQFKQALRETALPIGMMETEAKLFGDYEPAFSVEKWSIQSYLEETVSFPQE